MSLSRPAGAINIDMSSLATKQEVQAVDSKVSAIGVTTAANQVNVNNKNASIINAVSLDYTNNMLKIIINGVESNSVEIRKKIKGTLSFITSNYGYIVVSSRMYTVSAGSDRGRYFDNGKKDTIDTTVKIDGTVNDNVSVDTTNVVTPTGLSSTIIYNYKVTSFTGYSNIIKYEGAGTFDISIPLIGIGEHTSNDTTLGYFSGKIIFSCRVTNGVISNIKYTMPGNVYYQRGPGGTVNADFAFGLDKDTEITITTIR